MGEMGMASFIIGGGIFVMPVGLVESEWFRGILLKD